MKVGKLARLVGAYAAYYNNSLAPSLMKFRNWLHHKTLLHRDYNPLPNLPTYDKFRHSKKGDRHFPIPNRGIKCDASSH